MPYVHSPLLIHGTERRFIAITGNSTLLSRYFEIPPMFTTVQTKLLVATFCKRHASFVPIGR